MPSTKKPDFSNVVGGSSSTAPKPAGAEKTYTVVANDNLTKIAKKLYGDANKWRVIYEANQDQLKDPDKIRPGQKLKIPNLGESTTP